jgi:hypothetical protein
MVGGFAFSIIRRRKELGPLLRRIEDEEEEEMPEEPQPTPKRMPTLVDEPVAARIVTRR